MIKLKPRLKIKKGLKIREKSEATIQREKPFPKYQGTKRALALKKKNNA